MYFAAVGSAAVLFPTQTDSVFSPSCFHAKRDVEWGWGNSLVARGVWVPAETFWVPMSTVGILEMPTRCLSYLLINNILGFLNVVDSEKEKKELGPRCPLCVTPDLMNTVPLFQLILRLTTFPPKLQQLYKNLTLVGHSIKNNDSLCTCRQACDAISQQKAHPVLVWGTLGLQGGGPPIPLTMSLVSEGNEMRRVLKYR